MMYECEGTSNIFWQLLYGLIDKLIIMEFTPHRIDDT